MENISVIKIGKVNYYLSDDLMTNCPAFFKGCRNAREVINKKEIDEKHYIYAAFKNKKWNTRDGSNKRLDKVFFTTKWAEKNIPEFNDNIKYDIEMAPDIIELDDNEKFQDNEGNIIEIEVRGKREYNACYFLVKDVAQGFEMKNLIKILTGENVNYEIDKDYVYFNCKKINNVGKKTIKKELFLTYIGLLRVLFVSRSGNADKFIGWATKTLFTVQMGNVKEKRDLISDMMGVSPEAVKAVFSKSASTLPCIYLFVIGKIKNLRKHFEISDEYNDNDYVYRFGTTKELSRRTDEHNKSFGKIKGAELKLSIFNFIDVQYIFQAETELKSFMEGLEVMFECKGHKELVIIPKNKMKCVQKQFNYIGNNYIGHIKELVDKIKEKDAEIKEKNHDLKDKDRDLKDKDREIELVKKQHENELLKLDSKLSKKENELLKKELEMTKLQNSVKKSKSK